MILKYQITSDWPSASLGTVSLVWFQSMDQVLVAIIRRENVIDHCCHYLYLLMITVFLGI